MHNLIARSPQLLLDHLKETATLVEQKLSSLDLSKICSDLDIDQDIVIKNGKLIGFCHDLGKSENGIQESLMKNEKPKLSHPILSLPFYNLLSNKIFGEQVNDKIKEISGYVVLSHHAVPHVDLLGNLSVRISKKHDQFIFDPQIFNGIKNEWGIEVNHTNLIAELENILNVNRGEFDKGFDPTSSIANLKNSAYRTLFSIYYSILVFSDWESSSYGALSERSIETRDKQIKILRHFYDPQRTDIHNLFFNGNIKENLILELPTGFGKTILGVLYGLKNSKKIIYTLPTTTIIEDVYTRLSDDFSEDIVGWYNSYFLGYSDEDTLTEKEYFLSKHLLKPIMVTTLDQLLTSWLNIGRYPLKENILRNSTLILDEPQLYDPKMLVLFSKLIPEYVENGVKVVIMSATVPEFLKKELKGYGFRNITEGKEKEYYGKYNRTYFDLSYFSEPLVDTNGEIAGKILEKTKEFLSGNKNKILFTANTVERAQIIFDAIESWKNKCQLNFNLELFHARYILQDRQNKLKKLKEIEKSNAPSIIVTTQVIEAGVDISYGVMFREIAPLDSIIQSAGRINRRKRDNIVEEPHPIFLCNVNDPKPYTSAELSETKKLIEKYGKTPNESEYKYYELLQKWWEYLSSDFEREEIIVNDLIKKYHSSVFGVKIDEEKFKELKLREGILTDSVIPSCYGKDVEIEIQKLKEKSKTEKLKILSHLSKYFVQVPLYSKTSAGTLYKDLITAPYEDKYPWLKFINLKYHPIKGLLKINEPFMY